MQKFQLHIVTWSRVFFLTSCMVFVCQVSQGTNPVAYADEPELVVNESEIQQVEAEKQKKNRKKNPATPATSPKAVKKTTLNDLKPVGIADQDLLKGVLAKLDLIDQNLAKFDGVPYQAEDRNGKLQFLVDSPGVQVYFHGNNLSTRVFGCYLIVANLQDQPAEFPLEQLKLNESGKDIALSALPESVKQYSLTMGDEEGVSLKSFDEKTVLKIPPQGVARALVVFHGLDQGNHIPKLELSLTDKGQEQTINVNRNELGLLNLEKKRVGPEGCLLHLIISGHSSMISSGSLIDELDLASSKGVTRTVIEWTQDATKFDSQCQNWYRQALEQHYASNQWFNEQYPSFPTTIHELHLAFTSTNEFFVNYAQNGFSDRAKIHVHKSSLEACSAALRTAVEILSHDQLVALLESNEPSSQVSVLAFAASKLTLDDLDLILPLVKHKDEIMVLSALSALSHLDHPEALSALLAAVSDSRTKVASVAIQALSNAKILAYQNALQKLYEKSELSVQQKIVRLIASNPHPKWLPVLLEQFATGPLDLRVEAIKAIGQIKPDNLDQLLIKAIADPDQKIWDTALGLMIKSPSQSTESEVLAKVNQQLEQGTVTGNMLTFIVQSRDPHTQRLLFKYWKSGKAKSNPKVMTELLNMLDPAILKEITEQYGSLTDNEKANYIKNYPIDFGDFDAYLSHWKTAINSENNSLHNAAQDAYRKNPDDKLLAIVIEALNREVGEKPNSNRVNKFCQLLSQNGTIEARKAIRDFRDASTHEQSINYADNALRNMYQNTSCYYFLYNARNQNEIGKYSIAIKQLDIAIKVDPDIPDYYLERARALIGTDNFDKAIQDYRKVIEIDRKHRTVWPLLADAYIEQRNFAKAVEVLDEGIGIFPKDASLWNSRGHAYAMMEKFEASLTNYQKALELDPKNSLSITGVALAETYMGNYEAGVTRLTKAAKNYPNDNLFAYNSACVYSRALEQLLKIESPSPAQQQLIGDYKQQGLKELRNSIDYGFVNDDWIKQDPDLVCLSKVDTSEFKELLKLAAEKKAELIKKKKSEQADE